LTLRSTTMKILIADDNPMWAKLLEENTRRWKFDPLVVPDGDAALECLRSEESICLAILDWQMPGVSGIDVCREIKDDHSRPFTYVVMLTSRDTKEDTVAGLDAGADDYLTKPVEMAVLKSRLGAARRIIEAIPPKNWTKPQIDGYDVQRVLGKGAFATVWEATRIDDGQSVAIKILRVDLATETVFGRFAREVKMLETLDHPYITRIYDSRVDRKVGYYVMDLVPGGTLYAYEKTAPSGVDRIRIIQRVCEGLDHAHQRGVIHRDMKFSNVMVDDEQLPKIVDFGMSKSLFAPRQSDLLETMEGSVLGTPLFMSPEQARGEINKLDGRSDLFSAAIMLYILLLRRHPYSLKDNDNRKIIEAISNGHARAPTELKPDFNPDLEAILMKALAAEPGDRYETAGEFAEALRMFLERRAG
ncbi:MAG: protein kinase, partial [Planctomycetota bacterium]